MKKVNLKKSWIQETLKGKDFPLAVEHYIYAKCSEDFPGKSWRDGATVCGKIKIIQQELKGLNIQKEPNARIRKELKDWKQAVLNGKHSDFILKIQPSRKSSALFSLLEEYRKTQYSWDISKAPEILTQYNLDRKTLIAYAQDYRKDSLLDLKGKAQKTVEKDVPMVDCILKNALDFSPKALELAAQHYCQNKDRIRAIQCWEDFLSYVRRCLLKPYAPFSEEFQNETKKKISILQKSLAEAEAKIAEGTVLLDTHLKDDPKGLLRQDWDLLVHGSAFNDFRA